MRFVGPLVGLFVGGVLGGLVAGQVLASHLRSTLVESIEAVQRLDRHRAESDLALLVSLRAGATDTAIASLERRMDGYLERLEVLADSAQAAETRAKLRAYREAAPPPAAATLDASSGIGGLLSSARILPVFESGEMAGLRVSHIDPDGPWAALGVGEGDLVVRVGEVPLDSPASSVALLEVLAGGREVEVRRVGDGRVELIPR